MKLKAGQAVMTRCGPAVFVRKEIVYVVELVNAQGFRSQKMNMLKQDLTKTTEGYPRRSKNAPALAPKIQKLLDEHGNKIIQDLNTEVAQTLRAFYSDIFKDRMGYRPRFPITVAGVIHWLDNSDTDN